MAFYVVAGGIVQCSHGGQSKILGGNSKLQISGSAAVTAGMESGIAFLPVGSPPTPNNPAPCTKTQPPPSNAPSPCTATVAATSGVSSKLLVDDQGVLLDSASGNTVNAVDPAAKWTIANPGQQLLQES